MVRTQVRDWHASLPRSVAGRDVVRDRSLDVRRYVGTPAEMMQPALADHVLCIHLGGPKTVHRWHDGRSDVHEVDNGALTLMPAGQANRWLTRGPIDFAHVVFDDELVGRVALEEFDSDPAAVDLNDRVGFRDTEVETLGAAMIASLDRAPVDGRLYVQSLTVLMMVALLKRQSCLSTRSIAQVGSDVTAGGLAPWRLKRVTDYMAANMADDIGLPELTALTGLSRAQFFRAFKQSVGSTPHRYLTDLRLDVARDLIQSRSADLGAVARAVGLSELGGFAALFRRRFGMTPRAYRAAQY